MNIISKAPLLLVSLVLASNIQMSNAAVPDKPSITFEQSRPVKDILEDRRIDINSFNFPKDIELASFTADFKTGASKNHQMPVYTVVRNNTSIQPVEYDVGIFDKFGGLLTVVKGEKINNGRVNAKTVEINYLDLKENVIGYVNDNQRDAIVEVCIKAKLLRPGLPNVNLYHDGWDLEDDDLTNNSDEFCYLQTIIS